jgi:streptomycin 6-kinase
VRFPDLEWVAGEPGGPAWLDALPRLVAESAARFRVRTGAAFPGGMTAAVLAATCADGTPAVLKVSWPHRESEHEAAALALLHGDGAVRLYATDADRHALLLERCEPGTPLARALPPAEQDVVIAGLLRRLWRHPPDADPFRPLSEMCDAWAAEFTGAPPLDPGIVRAGLALLRALPRDATEQVLLCTDLHGENVLSASREPWLMIDPKPYVGDPAYDVVQHMLNADRLRSDPLGLARRLAGLLDLDAERVRLWLFARSVQQSATWPELVAPAVRLAP